jgi:hypothetical protein
MYLLYTSIEATEKRPTTGDGAVNMRSVPNQPTHTVVVYGHAFLIMTSASAFNFRWGRGLFAIAAGPAGRVELFLQ